MKDAKMYNGNGTFMGTAHFALNENGEQDMVGFTPAPKKRYRLEIGGNLKDDTIAESFKDCDSHEARLAWMWAFAICDHPTHAWFNNPADPGIISNKRFTQALWNKLDERFKNLARAFADEDNRSCAADGIEPLSPWIDGRQ